MNDKTPAEKFGDAAAVIIDNQAGQIERLTERCGIYKNQVEIDATVIAAAEVLVKAESEYGRICFGLIRILRERIAILEEALPSPTIPDAPDGLDPDRFDG